MKAHKRQGEENVQISSFQSSIPMGGILKVSESEAHRGNTYRGACLRITINWSAETPSLRVETAPWKQWKRIPDITKAICRAQLLMWNSYDYTHECSNILKNCPRHLGSEHNHTGNGDFCRLVEMLTSRPRWDALSINNGTATFPVSRAAG